MPLGAAGQAAARAADGRVRAGGLVEDAARRRAHHRRHQRRPARRGGGGPVPRGPVLPAEHGGDRTCRRCASGARTSRCWPGTFSTASPRSYRTAGHRTSAPKRMQALLAYAWPGNVRELAHAVERAVLLARGERCSTRRPRAPAGGRRRRRALEEMSLEEVERFLIKKALARSRRQREPGGRRRSASRRSALYRRLQRPCDSC